MAEDMADDELEPLVTECPSCSTRFRVSEAQLQRAGGRVRCGACLHVFNGVRHLIGGTQFEAPDHQQAQQALDALLDELADHTPARPRRREPERTEPPVGDDEARRRARPALFAGFEEPESALDPARAPGSPSEVPGEADAGAGAAVPASSVAQPAEASAVEVPTTQPVSAPDPAFAPLVFGEPRIRRPLVWSGIALGLLLLAAQVLWYQFDEWGKQPQWRGVYSGLCVVLGCELPQQRDLDLLSTRNLTVRSYPDQPGRLLVDAVIVNEAPFAQPFPELELRFTTVHGNLVAGHRVQPVDYLAGDAAGMTLIPPRTPVQIELVIDDPGADAVNYFLRFR